MSADKRADTMDSTPPLARPRSPRPRTRTSWLDRALPILDHLLETGAPLSTYAIAKGIGAPLSTIYGVIDAMVEADMLVKRADGSIWLGPRLYRYGLAYARSLDTLGAATQEMEALCRRTGETVQICGRDGDEMVVLAMADGPGHFRVSSRVGTRVPLNWTASGRLLLGHLPEHELEAAFRRAARPSITGLAETDPARLAAAAREAHARRLAVQISESDYLVACVAAPVCNERGECVVTISIVLPGQKLETAPDRYAASVQESSRRIEAALGWTMA
jgi:DNA-binding IclR family transcriptional regulator